MNYSLLKFLNNCKSLKTLKSAHALLVVNGIFASSDVALNKIIRAYCRFGSTHDAHKVFDKISQPNVFLWTSMIHGHVENKLYSEAFFLFLKMLRDSVAPLNYTIITLLKGLAREARLTQGEVVHGLVLKCGFDTDIMVQNSMLDLLMRCEKPDLARGVFDEIHEKDIISWNTMISGYCNKGRMDIARELFCKMPDRNVISWTTIIHGYVKMGDMTEARYLFDEMPEKDLASWNVMLSGYVENGDLDNAVHIFNTMPSPGLGSWNLIISGCCKLGNLESARNYFDKIPNKNTASWTIMIDGYMKSGNVNEAKALFDQMPEKNLITWSTMIGGYAKNEQPKTALELLKIFKKQSIKPDETFILVVISACSQLGVLDAAESAIHDYVGPDIFSNNLICGMKVGPTAAVWSSLLAACVVHREAEVAEVAAGELFKIEPENSGNYVLLSNVYAGLGEWEKVGRVRGVMRGNLVRKNRGSSWIELECVVYEFVMGDFKYLNCVSVKFVLDLLREEMEVED